MKLISDEILLVKYVKHQSCREYQIHRGQQSEIGKINKQCLCDIFTHVIYFKNEIHFLTYYRVYGLSLCIVEIIVKSMRMTLNTNKMI